MTPEQLKASLLQYAMKGRITEQLESDGNASELLPLLNIDPKVKANNPPFDIPENWLWIPIGNLGESTGTDSFSDGPFGSNLKTVHYITEPEVRIIQLSNIGENGWKDQNVKYTSYKHLEEVIPRCEVHPGDFVIAKMMPAGRTIEVPNLGTRITLGSDAMKFVPNKNLDKKYLLWAMHSQAFLEQVYSEAHGITRVRTTLNGVKSYVLPIPPLKEQHRIVAKIEEMLPYVERYAEAYEKLEQFNAKFPEDMKKSILQYAIQGKLVEQRPEEGTAEELYQQIQENQPPLKDSKSDLVFDAMDFDIPETWKWVEVNQIFDFVDYRGKTPNKIAEGVFLVTASNIRQGYMDYTRKEHISRDEYETRKSRGITEKGDLLFTTEAPMGNAAICDLEECSCGQRVITFKEYTDGTVYSKLFMYFILSPAFQKQLVDNCTGTTAKGIKADKLKHLLLPLPPISEQYRIVEKIDELLPFCNRLSEGR